LSAVCAHVLTYSSVQRQKDVKRLQGCRGAHAKLAWGMFLPISFDIILAHLSLFASYPVSAVPSLVPLLAQSERSALIFVTGSCLSRERYAKWGATTSGRRGKACTLTLRKRIVNFLTPRGSLAPSSRCHSCAEVSNFCTVKVALHRAHSVSIVLSNR
jgi:hypothetical protein